MAKLIGLCRIGRDAEVRFLPDGTAVVNLALAYNYGKKGQDGKKPSQWIDASFWGERAKNAAPHFTRGTQIDVFISDVHVETYKKDGVDIPKLVGRLDDFEFAASGAKPAQQSQPAQQQAAQQQQNAYAAASGGAANGQKAATQQRRQDSWDDFEEDIPF